MEIGLFSVGAICCSCPLFPAVSRCFCWLLLAVFRRCRRGKSEDFRGELRLPGCFFAAFNSDNSQQHRAGLSGESLVEIADQVFGAFEADRQADYVGAGAGSLALLVGELAVGCRGGVQDQAAGIADIGEVGEQPHVFDELDPRLVAALDAEG
jgi:hypothetical protein